mgnify:CR=1 FL=1
MFSGSKRLSGGVPGNHNDLRSQILGRYVLKPGKLLDDPENGGQPPDQPGPPVPAEYRGAGRLFDGCVTTFRHGSEKVFSGFLLKLMKSAHTLNPAGAGIQVYLVSAFPGTGHEQNRPDIL